MIGINLTHQQQRVFAMLERAANDGVRCPSNSEIANGADLMHHSDASSLVRQLEGRGVISVARAATTRVVTILATGRATAPESRRPGYNPLIAIDTSYRGPVPEHLLVDRDPCPRCGVRRDIGCRCSSVQRIGVAFGLGA